MKKTLLTFLATFLLCGMVAAQDVSKVLGTYVTDLYINIGAPISENSEPVPGVKVQLTPGTMPGTVNFELRDFEMGEGMMLGDIVLPNIPLIDNGEGNYGFGENAPVSLTLMEVINAQANLNTETSYVRGDELMANVDVVWLTGDEETPEVPIYVRAAGTKEQVADYSGAREGCNMPLRVNGTIIGVVGIWGDPPEIKALAHLLEVYAAKYFQLEAMASPRLADRELRGRVLRALLAPADRAMADAKVLMDSLGLRLEFPLQVIVFSDRTGAARSERQEQLLNFLAAQGWLRPERELWGTVDDRLVLLCACAGHCAAALYHRDAAHAGVLADYRLCIGDVCRTEWDIAAAYQQAAALEAVSPRAVSDLRDPSTRCDYLLYSAAIRDADFLEELYARLGDAFRESELPLLFQTAECYYRHGRSVTQAASELFIHKNTLQYRVRRLLEALELERCGPFQEEFLMRLLLEHHKRKQSRQALE